MGSICAYSHTCIYNIIICIYILTLRVRGWGKAHRESWSDNLKCKSTFAEIQEYSLKQKPRRRTALQLLGLTSVLWNGSGLVGVEMLCCGKSCKHMLNTWLLTISRNRGHLLSQLQVQFVLVVLALDDLG